MFHLRRWLTIGWLGAAIAGSACTTDGVTPAGPNPSCVPGQQAPCVCDDGTSGAQRCRDDGTFESCRCEGSSSDGGGGGGDDAGSGLCVEGETRPCDCPAGASGFALCLEGGQSWSECVCDAPEADETPQRACERVVSSAEGETVGGAIRLRLSNRDALRDDHPQVPPGCLVGNGAMGFARAIRHVMSRPGRLSARSNSEGTSASLDTVIVVTAGRCDPAARAVACNDDIDEKTYTSRAVTPPLAAGDEVTIWVGGYDPPWNPEVTAVGEIELVIEEQAEMPTCTPRCTAADGSRAACGSDGCGGTCGTCGEGTRCVGTRCESTCEAACGSHTCGPDGCGGSCGECAPGLTCDANGTCTCSPRCAPGACGPNSNGCGGSCACPAGQVCNSGRCGPAPCVSRCVPGACGGSNGCGGTCGCSGGQACVGGRCMTCSRCTMAGAGGRCGAPCGCGQVTTCERGLTCVGGTCRAPVCVPRCSACGASDGCGGFCRCADGQTCIGGTCRAPTCTPRCAPGLCGGGNGCGGVCGCESGLTCQSGRCARPSSGGGSSGGGASGCRYLTNCVTGTTRRSSTPSARVCRNEYLGGFLRNNCRERVECSWRIGSARGLTQIGPGMEVGGEGGGIWTCSPQNLSIVFICQPIGAPVTCFRQP